MLAETTMQFKTGFNGWKNLIFKAPEVEQLADQRRLQNADACR